MTGPEPHPTLAECRAILRGEGVGFFASERAWRVAAAVVLARLDEREHAGWSGRAEVAETEEEFTALACLRGWCHDTRACPICRAYGTRSAVPAIKIDEVDG